MASGYTTTYRVMHCRLQGIDTGGYGEWHDSHVLLAGSVSDPIAPNWPRARLQLNFPRLGDHVWNWGNYLGVDDAVAIVSAEPAASRKILFAGFVADVDWRMDAGGEGATITAVGYPFRLARDREYLVYGRYMLSKAAAVTHYSAPRTVFNADGLPNATSATYDVADGAPQVALFSYDDDPAGGYWRALDAIQYLLWTYNAAQTWMANPTFTAEQLAASPVIHDVDVTGMGLWEALATVASAGGYDVAATVSMSEGLPTYAIEVTKHGEGVEVELDHQPPNADGSLAALSAARTNLFAASVAETTASCVTAPVVAGGQNLYEITVELQRAWDPANLALPSGALVIQPGREVNQAATPYVKRYVIGGDDFEDYSYAARLWDANTDGYFSGTPYNLSVTDVATAAGQAAGSWPVMPYKAMRMLTSLAGTPMAAGCETYLEASINGGVTWYQIDGYRVLPGRLGVYLNKPNLAVMLDKSSWAKDTCLIGKLIDSPSSVKLRLTCTVAAPDRQMALPGRRPTAGTIFPAADWFDRAKIGQLRRVVSMSKFYAAGHEADTTDDTTETARLTARAGTLQDLNEDRFVEAGQMTIEWIVDPANAPLCGRVQQIGGIGVDLRTNSGAATRCPRIVRREFLLAADRYQTILTLDTDRKAAEV